MQPDVAFGHAADAGRYVLYPMLKGTVLKYTTEV